jgi:mono/diheme cytochrome c family protein
MRSRLLILAIVAALGAGCAKHTTVRADDGAEATRIPADVGRGKTVFTAQCSACHGATGIEGGIGPSLADEKNHKDAIAAEAFIKNPDPPMPKLWPGTLSASDVADVTAYVESLSR